jgi:hypothetical protein
MLLQKLKVQGEEDWEEKSEFTGKQVLSVGKTPHL